jgi:hypothetical protein
LIWRGELTSMAAIVQSQGPKYGQASELKSRVQELILFSPSLPQTFAAEVAERYCGPSADLRSARFRSFRFRSFRFRSFADAFH